jgi:uncharacterized protein (DUF1015 family)
MIVRPFFGHVPPQLSVNDVISPRFDHVNRQDGQAMIKNQPKSFLRISRPDFDPDMNADIPSHFYERGVQNLEQMVSREWLIRVGRPSFYAYQQECGAHVQCGIFALVSCEQFRQGKIRALEETHRKTEEDRTIMLKTKNCNIEPVTLIFDSRIHSNVTSYIKDLCIGDGDRTAFTFFDNTDHKLWIIDDCTQLDQISNLFSQIDSMQIVDGVHYAYAALNVYDERKEAVGAAFTGNEAYCFFLAVICPNDNVRFAKHAEIIRGLTIETDGLISALEEKGFTIAPIIKCGNESALSMFVRGNWYSLNHNQLIGNSSRILADHIFKPLFGVFDLRSTPCVTYIRNLVDEFEIEKGIDENSVGFIVPGISLDQISEQVKEDRLLPPHSVCVMTRVVAGLLIRMVAQISSDKYG